MTMYTFFVLLQATPAWLRLTRDDRAACAAEHLGGALARTPDVTIRHFDAEAFSAYCSDVVVVQTADPVRHYDFMERLRDTPLLNVPYFDVVELIPAIENGYRAFEQREGA